MINPNPLICLDENLESWKIFEEKRIDCAKNLDMADTEFKVFTFAIFARNHVKCLSTTKKSLRRLLE